MTNQNLIDFSSGWRPFSNVIWDTTVKRNGSGSLRLDPSNNGYNAGRQLYNGFFAVKPLDEIRFIAYMKTGSSSIGEDSAWSGARIGVDLRHNHPAYGKVCLLTCEATICLLDHNDLDYKYAEADNYVHWNTSEWSRREIRLTVPDNIFSIDVYTGKAITPMQISEVSPWGQIWGPKGDLDKGLAWFADGEFYINPDSITPQVPNPPMIVETFTYFGEIFLIYKFTEMTTPLYWAESPHLNWKSVEYSTINQVKTNIADTWYNTLNPPVQPPPIEPPVEPPVTQPRTLAGRVPMVGNSALVQVYLRKIRDKLINKKLHEKLHPLV